MSTIKRFRTFKRDHVRHPLSSQQTEDEGEVYVVSKTVSLNSFLASVRPGDAGIKIKWVMLFAEPRSRKNPHPIRQVYAAFKVAKDKKVPIIEFASGLRSDRNGLEMLEVATDMLRRSGRALSGKRGGRPRTDPPPEVLAVMEAEWLSRKNSNDDQRRAAAFKRTGVRRSANWYRERFGSPLGEQKR